MIFKLHYWFLTAGASASSILLGIFIQTYTDASPVEIGALFMAMPFLGLIMRPLICSYADRYQAHQKFMLWCLLTVAVSYSPFIIIPCLGESFYTENARLCWYLLVFFKLIGNSAFGGVASIGDSLAINYSARIGTNYGVYRIWGTISWIIFGLIIGQINEVSFLPKYVPGFIILIVSSLLNMSLYWLWPKEYFLMIVPSKENRVEEVEDSADEFKSKNKLEQMTRSLMPKEEVLKHMKAKVKSLFLCQSSIDKDSIATEKQPKIVVGDFKLNSLAKKEEEVEDEKTSSIEISKMAQARILLLLLRRDVRIVLYFLVFICAGFNFISMNFFFISLSGLCTESVGCNYSSLAGLLQASMAGAETLLFIYIGDFEKLFGRVNMIAFCFFLMASKFTFYGTIWTSVSPYYSLISESMHGVVYGIFMALQVETAHMFANEVEFILPELIEKKVVSEDDNVEKLKLSLSATMQAIMTSACDGIGCGFAALIYGIVIDKYSFKTLWLSIGVCASVAFSLTILISIFDRVFNLNLGLDKKNKRVSQSSI